MIVKCAFIVFVAERFNKRVRFPQIMLVIGIVGRTKSGKTTLANRMDYVYDTKVFSHATPVRVEVGRAWFKGNNSGKVADTKWSLLEMENKEILRPVLRSWAEARRQIISSDYWVEKVWDDIYDENPKRVVFDDVRYPNELLRILDNGGYIVRLVASDETLIERGSNELSLAHASETSLIQATLHEATNPKCITINVDGKTENEVWGAVRDFIANAVVEECS
tara:strand:+ start:1409 stop:2074 length:666 start_codon:yes stop_codon:yes gene_type:complete